MKDVVSILQEAKALLAKGWCQGKDAEDTNGKKVHWKTQTAARFCMIGAIYRVNLSHKNTFSIDFYQAVGLVEKAIVLEGYEPLHITDWNDLADTTQGNVLSVMDRAIADAMRHRQDMGST